jgi:hypothetical protein
MGGRGNPTERATIGRHGDPWTAERARDRAEDLKEMVRRGINPIKHERQQREAEAEGRKDSARLAFDTYVELFERKYIDAKGLRSGDDIKSVSTRFAVSKSVIVSIPWPTAASPPQSRRTNGCANCSLGLSSVGTLPPLQWRACARPAKMASATAC